MPGFSLHLLLPNHYARQRPMPVIMVESITDEIIIIHDLLKPVLCIGHTTYAEIINVYIFLVTGICFSWQRSLRRTLVLLEFRAEVDLDVKCSSILEQYQNYLLIRIKTFNAIVIYSF